MHWSHLYHLLSLHPLIADINSRPPTALIITDPLGNLSSLQLLKAVALGATPLVNLLWVERKDSGLNEEELLQVIF